MLAKMIDKIVSLKKTEVFEFGGEHYTDREVYRVPPHVDRPKGLTVTGLDSVCKLIRTEMGRVGTTVLVHVSSPTQVDVFTTYLNDYSRHGMYTARSDVPEFREGWRTPEKSIIELRSLFIPNEGTEYLLNLLSRVSFQQEVVTADNGVTQQVEARQGAALKSLVAVKPRVDLIPFRTFLEVPQPESTFLLRVDSSNGVGLFEADGGVWKLEAKKNIAAYFEKELSDCIKDGLVVVMR